MNRTVTYHITEADANMQILNFLRSKGFSRHILSSMKAEKNAIYLNGEKAGGRTLLKNQDVLKILVPETGSTEHIIPVPMNLSVLYEDEDILAVDKPAGMPVHPSMGNYENTLANGSAFYFESKNLFCPFRCINRLDRDTSGALLLAKNPLSAAILSTQMKHRKIRRTYLAVVKGITPEKGKISAPIARLGDSVIQRCVDFDRGESAVTFYERLIPETITLFWNFIWKPGAPIRSAYIWDIWATRFLQTICTARITAGSAASLFILYR